MTKVKVASVEEAVATVPPVEDNDRWLRDSALGYAITHHKNNGGMTTAQQILANAGVFLNFLKGEQQ
jgi:hypothetical protein